MLAELLCDLAQARLSSAHSTGVFHANLVHTDLRIC